MGNKTREDWLTQAINLIEQRITSQQGACLPEVWSVGVGFPSRAKAIGQAWDKNACADKETHHIIISPTLGKKDTINLLQVLTHEIIHISVGIDQKHGGEFKRVARAIGLEGRLTATYVSPENPLAGEFRQIAEDIGWEYPHEEIIIESKDTKPRKSNFIYLVSGSRPEYKLKIKKSIIADSGYPTDPWGDEMVEEDN